MSPPLSPLCGGRSPSPTGNHGRRCPTGLAGGDGRPEVIPQLWPSPLCAVPEAEGGHEEGRTEVKG